MGKKRSIGTARQFTAIEEGGKAIERMSEASRKRTKVAKDMLKVDRKKSMILLFSMPDADLGFVKALHVHGTATPTTRRANPTWPCAQLYLWSF